MAHGRFEPGHPKIGGRKKGTRDKRDQVRCDLLESLVKLPEQLASMTPLEAMLLCMRWSLQQNDRRGVMEAASAAAPYCHPKLTSSDVRLGDQRKLDAMSDEELAAKIEELERKLRESEPVPNGGSTIES